MAYLNTNANTLGHNALLDVLRGNTENLRARFAAYRVYRTTLNELRGLSGRELADLGLNRSSLKRIALEAAYGETVGQ